MKEWLAEAAHPPKPELARKAHKFLASLYQDGNLILLRGNGDLGWFLYNIQSNETRHDLRETAQELLEARLLERNEQSRFNIKGFPPGRWVAYELNAHALTYLADYFPDEQTFLDRDRNSKRGYYTTDQAEGLDEAHGYGGPNLHDIVIGMFKRGATIHLNEESGWRFIWEDVDLRELSISGYAFEELSRRHLIWRDSSLDGRYRHLGHKQAHSLSNAGESLADHLERGHYDPRDARLNSHDYAEHLSWKEDQESTDYLDYMTEPGLSEDAFDALAHCAEHGGILARDRDKTWFYIRPAHGWNPLTRISDAWQQPFNELKRHKVIQHNRVATFASIRPRTQLAIYELTPEAIETVADYIKMPHAYIQKEIDTQRGTYTTEQAEGLHRLMRDHGDKLFYDLVAALTDMRRAPDSVICQSQRSNKGRRWYLIGADGHHERLALSKPIVMGLLELDLITPDPSRDEQVKEDGYGACHTLSADGRSLISHYARGFYDPSDQRLSIKNVDELVDIHWELHHPYDPHAKEKELAQLFGRMR